MIQIKKVKKINKIDHISWGKEFVIKCDVIYGRPLLMKYEFNLTEGNKQVTYVFYLLFD